MCASLLYLLLTLSLSLSFSSFLSSLCLECPSSSLSTPSWRRDHAHAIATPRRTRESQRTLCEQSSIVVSSRRSVGCPIGFALVCGLFAFTMIVAFRLVSLSFCPRAEVNEEEEEKSLREERCPAMSSPRSFTRPKHLAVSLEFFPSPSPRYFSNPFLLPHSPFHLRKEKERQTHDECFPSLFVSLHCSFALSNVSFSALLSLLSHLVTHLSLLSSLVILLCVRFPSSFVFSSSSSSSLNSLGITPPHSPTLARSLSSMRKGRERAKQAKQANE